VLVLAHADRLGIDLHQLGQRVLQPPGDGDGGAQRQVQLRELLARHVGRGVDRRAGLVDHRHHGPALGRDVAEGFLHQLVRLAAGGAVPHRDQLHRVLGGEAGDLVAEAVLLVQVHDAGGQQRAGAADDGQLAPGAEPGIHAQHRARTGGRGQQQRLQVLPEDGDRLLVGARLQLHPHLHLHRGEPGGGGTRPRLRGGSAPARGARRRSGAAAPRRSPRRARRCGR
jgi:hypothetical protein